LPFGGAGAFVVSVTMPRRLLALLVVVLVLVPVRPVAAAAAAAVWHVVRPGETLAGIASARGIPPADLGRWNGIAAPYPVFVDETLWLTPPPSPPPGWRSRIEPVTPVQVGWTPGWRCPVRVADLRRIWVSYVDLLGRYHEGSIVMHKSLAVRTQRVFLVLFWWRFRIQGMVPMAVNMPGETDPAVITSGFQCRPVAGSTTWSQHAYGRAIDLNPLQNPEVRGSAIDPPGAARWLPRNGYQIGMLHAEGAVTALTANGFSWGGRWNTLKDYMHFSTTNL
jgi:D-alanyl-D-alanine carboxypeptidase/LysM domain